MARGQVTAFKSGGNVITTSKRQRIKRISQNHDFHALRTGKAADRHGDGLRGTGNGFRFHTHADKLSVTVIEWHSKSNGLRGITGIGDRHGNFCQRSDIRPCNCRAAADCGRGRESICGYGFRTGTVIMNLGICQRFIITFNRNGVPLCFRIAVVDIGQSGTVGKRKSANTGYAGRNRNGGEITSHSFYYMSISCYYLSILSGRTFPTFLQAIHQFPTFVEMFPAKSSKLRSDIWKFATFQDPKTEAVFLRV